MFNKLKRIRLRPLLSHIVITLCYPVVRAATTPQNRLLVFTDAITIIALVLIIGGVVYSTILHGDYDISGFLLNRGIVKDEEKTDYKTYKKDQKKKREELFNYPLFLGIVYLVAAGVIAQVFL